MKKVLLIALLIVILDQIIKIYVKTTMTISQDGLDMLFMKIHFVENDGMAFGTVLPFKYGKIALSLLRLIAITFILFYIKRLLNKKAPLGLLIAVSCVLAGAVGNVIDGAFYGMIFSESTYFEVAKMFPAGGGYQSFMMGKVVDMFEFTFQCPQWLPWYDSSPDHLLFPFIFNLADAAISIGVASILIWHRKYFKGTPIVQTELVNDSNVVSSEEE